jgi:hypothetical protein
MSLLDAALELALIVIPIPFLLWSERVGSHARKGK